MATKLSLTPIVGPQKSRSIKKVGFYFFSGMASLAIVGLLVLFGSVYYVGYQVVNELPVIGPAEWRTDVKITVLLLLQYLPVLIWALHRVWYKYASAQEAVLYERDQNITLWEFIRGTHKEVIDPLAQKIIADQGNWRNDLAGFSLEEVRQMLEDPSILEQLEEKAAEIHN